MYRVERDWYGLIDEIEQASEKQAAKIRKILQESVLSSADVFAAKPYFLSDEFTLTDCSIAPVLWRLPYYGIELPAEARPINRYAERIFARPSFRASLTEIEREMRL
jgi:RNA polymerase-associated protein